MRQLRGNLIYLLATLLIFFMGNVVLAADLSLEEVIQQGLQTNGDLLSLESQITSIQGQLAEIEASQGWQVQLNGYSDYRFYHENNLNTGFSISLSQADLWGITFQPEVRFQDQLTPQFTIKMNHQLYPNLPTEVEKRYWKTQNELVKAKAKLAQERSTKLLSWVESYLNLQQIKKNYELAEKKVDLAKEELEQTKIRHQLQDASPQQVLTAQIQYQQANYELENWETRLAESLHTLNLELGFETADESLFTKTAQLESKAYLKRLRSFAETELVELKGSSLSQQLEDLKKENYQLLVHRLDIQTLEQELTWLEGEQKAKFHLNGSYDSKNEDLSVGVNFSYSLYDHGQGKIQLANQQQKLAEKVRVGQELEQQLNLELQRLYHKLKLQELAVEIEETKLTKAMLDEKVATQQYQSGLLVVSEYEQAKLKAEEAAMNLRSAQAQLLLTQLKLIQFVQNGLFD